MTTENLADAKPSARPATMAAFTAVAFWSLKPVLISIISDRGGFAEAYLTAGIISVIASAIGMIVLCRRTGVVVQGGRESLSGVAQVERMADGLGVLRGGGRYRGVERRGLVDHNRLQ